MTTSNEVTRTVDLTPSHAFEAAICIEVLKNPDASPEGIKDATEGLMNLARACDKAAKDRELHHNEFNLAVRVTDKQVLHLLTDAIDTGHSSYWFTISGYNFPEGVTREDFREGGRLSAPASAGGNYFHPDELIPFVGEIVVTDSESGESLGVLNRETMAKGLRLMAENYPAHWANFWGGRGDAETGDVWLQLAVMGKLIYG